MKYRTLGASGLVVSPVCLGTMTFGTPVGESDAITLVNEAIDLGINFIDTANAYEGYARVLGSKGGVAETILGKAIKNRRDEVVITTKVGAPIGPGPQDRGLCASHILREVDRSLSRLQTDYIDLYLIHWPDCCTPLETTLGAIHTAMQQGKVRCFGVSNHFAWQICELLWLADRNGWPNVIASQIPLSLLRREYHNDLEFCRQRGVGVTPYQVLQGGLLTGKYRRGQAANEGTRLFDHPDWIWQPDDVLFDKLEATEALASELGISFSRYSIAWALAQPAVSSVLVGVTRKQQIEDAIAAAGIEIPPEILARQDKNCPPPWDNSPKYGRI